MTHFWNNHLSGMLKVTSLETRIIFKVFGARKPKALWCTYSQRLRNYLAFQSCD